MTYIGTLNDEDIIEYCNKGILIKENFSKENIKQACYELTASEIYYDISSNSDKKNLVSEHKYILIKPKQIVVILTEETLFLPNDMLGRILTKGKLFSVGLLPVNTYADPGFNGKLGIVFTNVSNNYLKITPGDAIAKIEFNKLEKPVLQSNSYSGQHGYGSGFWHIPRDYVLTKEEIKADKRIKTKSQEIESSYGKEFAGAINRIEKYEKKFLILTIGYLTGTLILIGVLSGTNWLSTTSTVLLGVGINLLYGLGTILFTKR